MRGSVIIAGTQSGSGKTTLSVGIMAALKAAGLPVQPFKVGPDFIDPAYHAFITGMPSRNLDGWMMGKKAVRETFARHAPGCGVAVIEGVMGLFDGTGKDGLEGSTAEVAKLTGAPVVLVVDARSMAGSAAALVKGFETLDPEINIAGVILNRVGSARHEELLRSAIKRSCGSKVIGAVPRDEGLDIPSRHLGLTTDVAGILTKKFVNRLRRVVEKHVDMKALLNIAAKAPKPDAVPERPSRKKTAKLAVAMDEAFCFYYQDNLDILEAAGLEIVPFSPLKDGGLPEGVSGIYLGGGYPEMYALGLSFNDFVKTDIAQAAGDGIPVYAECGGLMYMTRGITDKDGVFFQMAGVLPGQSTMLDRRHALGYREVTPGPANALFPQGGNARGHEFHYSETVFDKARSRHAWLMKKNGDDREYKEGFTARNVTASYVHLHFASNAAFARSFAKRVKEAQAPFKRA
jgi:cobyrinic acid a,c-diamide synthase